MSASCDRRNPIVRGGTPQHERAPAALDPDYFEVDERTTADLVLFAERYSRRIRYYGAENGQENEQDWHPFFSEDVTAILAGLAALPVDSFLAFSRNLQKDLRAGGDWSEDALKSHLLLLFHLPVMLLVEVVWRRDRLAVDHPRRGIVDEILERDVESPLRKLVAYYRGGIDLHVLADQPLDEADYKTEPDEDDPRIQIPRTVLDVVDPIRTRLDTPLTLAKLIEAVAPTDWGDLFAEDPDTGPYEELGGGGSVHEKIHSALTHSLFRNAFGGLYQAVERVVLEAREGFAESLESFDGHTPHYGLWLAFLRLLEFGRSDMNSLTGRHLDHYYRDVLRLRPRKARPDRVHLLLELSKNREERLLRAGDTRFKAGKDDTGRDVVYRLDDDIVVNQARVDSLKAVYRPSVDVADGSALAPYAAPVADSTDGRGEELPKDDPRWKPFGPAIEPPDARVGFAIADRRLFLREGSRTIQVEAEIAGSTPSDLLAGAFRALLTVEDGWLEVRPPNLSVRLDPGRGVGADLGERRGRRSKRRPRLVFEISLGGDDPPVVFYDPEVHGDRLPTSRPVLRIEFAFATDRDAAAEAFTGLRTLRFRSLETKAIVQGVRELVIQNEEGVVDPTKPFLPFGSTPRTNSPLILGSSEVFSKPLDSITLDIDWETRPSARAFFTRRAASEVMARFRHLQGGRWQGGGGHDVQLYPSRHRRGRGRGKARGRVERLPTGIELSDLDDLSSDVQQTLEDEPYTTGSTAGFIRLELDEGFGHEIHPDKKTVVLIALARGKEAPVEEGFNYDDAGIPKEPYTPKIDELRLDYETALSQVETVFHLHPFGHTEADGRGDRLFPDLPYEGELYIGVRHLDPPQRLSLLFRTVEGSSNPLKGQNDLAWHYLRGDRWVALEEQLVDDKTYDLSATGIVGIAVPEDADTEHRLLPTGLHWFRMAARTDADALNDLLDVDAQAVSATFVDRGNDPRFLATPLPAGTISKLETSDSAIKKIRQPSASFGGRPEESDRHFRLRVSERLRHKDRASTMWDYERLVLERFPEIYKAKCVNHTRLHRDPENEILADNELAPGHVLLVTVPFVSGDRGRDRLRPYTRKGTLLAIDRFLRDRVSPFVRLEVQNPKFEEVQVRFRVKFRETVADLAFYREELAEAVVRFLSPWAYDEGAEISFGGRWHKSALVDFVEEREYVDYVEEFEMYHKVDASMSDAEWKRVDVEVAEATTARSILVSHPTHIVEEIP